MTKFYKKKYEWGREGEQNLFFLIILELEVTHKIDCQ